MQTEVGREIIQQVLAGYQDIVRRQSVTLTLGGEPIEDTLFATLELKVPPISAKAGREITLSDALKHTPQPDRARNLCELFQASAAQSEEKQKPDGGMELDINGTCMGIDASVNFSRRGVSLQIQKPVTEPLNVVEPMVNRALSFVQSWQAFATRVRNPKEFAVIQPQVTEMIFSAYLLREADRLHIPEQDRIQLIARFEQACEKVGLPDTEPTFAMITYIFREPELREKMNKCSLHDEGYSYSWRDKLDRHTGTSYSSLDGAMAFLRTAVSGARDMGGGNRLNVDPLMPDFQRAIANGGLKEDNVSAAFRAMRLIGRQPDAVRADLITRALMAVGGSDVALYYYLKTHKLAAEVSETDNRVSVKSTNFKGVAQILEEFGKTAAVDAGL
ncbi:hypothetical protein FJZ33_04350, partial [Candidatus Poribacteria bacterium]|nr:hypothetical protein [Candidatus Poribacteria bacterium]